MNCKRCESLLDQYLDGLMEASDKAALEEHLHGCAHCRLRMQVLEDSRRINEEDEVPVSFSASWRQAIQDEEVVPMKRQTPGWTKWLAMAAALVVVVAGTWLTGNELNRISGSPVKPAGGMAGGAGYYSGLESADSAANYDMDAPAMAESAMTRSAPAPQMAAQPQETKIIRTLSIQSATRNFDADYQTIRQDLEKIGGRVENAEVRTGSNGLRTAYLTLRVPAARLDSFAEQLKGMGHLQSISESAQDVSERYYDTDARLKTQLAKMERLRALMEKAASVEELISLESAIADTQYQIDSYTGQLKGMDSQVNDATLNLTLSEMSALDTAETKAETLWDRIASGTVHMWQMLKIWAADAAVFLAAVLPVIILIAIVVIIIKAIVKRRNKK